MRRRWVFLAGVFLSAAGEVAAQERSVEALDLPRWVEEDVITFFNDPSTIQFSGQTRIPSTRVILGDVGSLGGPFTLAGEVDGDLVVVNGDLVFETGGTVSGNVLVVGGRVLGEELGQIGGDLRVFDEPLRYVRRGDRIAPAGRRSEGTGFGPDFPWGDARFTVKAGQNYNRVEGLPVIFGPSIRTGGANPLRLNLFAIWRTEMGVDLDEEDFGWALRVEQSLGGRDRLRFGGTYFSMVEPIEDWGLTNLEASLATFILHKDYRDYFQRKGWSAFGRLHLPYLPVELSAEFVEEKHEFAQVRAPWSLTKNNDPWREQPLVAQGKTRYLEASLGIDTRNQENDPTDGWYLEGRLRRGISGELRQPEYLSSAEDDASSIPGQGYDEDFLTGFLDVRTYNRVGPHSSLNLRGVLAGALNDVHLPPQFQHALGGLGSLPGYSLFAADCGAREEVRGYDVTSQEISVRNPVFAAYGCDRIALFQAEFRGSLFMDWSFGDWGDEGEDPWTEDWSWYPSIDLSPNWAAFFDVGRGYTVDGVGDTDTLMDIGVGLFLGDLGVYYAFPLKEDKNGDRDGQFFIRLSRRF